MHELNVEPPALTRSGHHVGKLRERTHEVFGNAHSEMGDAVSSGWVGASADAMRARLESMRTAADHVTTRLDDHSQRFHSSAREFAATDGTAADRIDSTTSRTIGGRSSLNLND